MNTTPRHELIAQLATARACLRAAIAEYVASPCDATELAVASKGATVCALERKLDARQDAFAALTADAGR